MTIYLYNTESPPRKVYKQLDNEYQIDNVVFKDTEDVVNPVLLLHYTQNIDRTRYNYAYIPSLHRYYFINSFQVLTGQVVAISLQCDVLMTYKPFIDNSDLNIVKIGTGGSTMIPDSGLPLYPYKDLKIIKFPTTPFFNNLTHQTSCFVLIVAGGA